MGTLGTRDPGIRQLQRYSQSRRTACRHTERGLEDIPTASSIQGLWGFQELYQAKSWNGRNREAGGFVNSAVNRAIHKATVWPAAIQNVVWRPAPFTAYGGFRNCTRQNHGTAGTEAGGFVNSAVKKYKYTFFHFVYDLKNIARDFHYSNHK